MSRHYLACFEAVERTATTPTRAERWVSFFAALTASLIGTSGCHLLLGYEEETQELQPGPTTSSSQGGAAGMQGGGGAGGEGGVGGMGGAWACREVAESAFAATPPLGPVDESFTSPSATLSRWGARFFVQNEGLYTGVTPCIATLCPGELRILPGPPEGSSGYLWWHNPPFFDQSGPVVYQRVAGNFAIAVDVELELQGAMPARTGAGIVVRNPNTTNNYVYYSLAHRDVGYSTQALVRIPGGPPGGGNTYWANPPTTTTALAGRLMVCMVDGYFAFYRRLTDDTKVESDGPTSAELGFSTLSEVEVGFSAHWFDESKAPSEGVFRNVRFYANPTSHEACKALLE